MGQLLQKTPIDMITYISRFVYSVTTTAYLRFDMQLRHLGN